MTVEQHRPPCSYFGLRVKTDAEIAAMMAGVAAPIIARGAEKLAEIERREATSQPIDWQARALAAEAEIERIRAWSAPFVADVQTTTGGLADALQKATAELAELRKSSAELLAHAEELCDAQEQLLAENSRLQAQVEMDHGTCVDRMLAAANPVKA